MVSRSAGVAASSTAIGSLLIAWSSGFVLACVALASSFGFLCVRRAVTAWASGSSNLVHVIKSPLITDVRHEDVHFESL